MQAFPKTQFGRGVASRGVACARGLSLPGVLEKPPARRTSTSQFY